jgi:hypothetical protein
MRRALIGLLALMANAALVERASATTACAWIVETVEDDGGHKFALNLSTDAPADFAVRVHGATFTSGAMGGELIHFDPGEARDVDAEGFDVSPGDDLDFDAQLYARPMTDLDEMEHPAGQPLAAFAFHRKVGEAERTPPADLAARQCKPLGG